MRLLVTGGTGVLGRALRPLAEAAGHELATPGHDELDLFDPTAVADAVRGVDGGAVTGSASRTSASPGPPDGTRRRRFVT